MGTRKYLIAIDHNPVEKQALHCICQELRSQCRAGRKNTEDMYHITLVVIEDAPDDKLPDIRKVIKSVAAAQHPFTILTGKAGFFGTESSATVWISVSEGHDELKKLHDKLLNKLAGVGLQQEEAPFQPHITLGREVDITVFNPPLGETLLPSVNLTAHALTLLERRIEDGKTVYEPIATVNFPKSK